MPVLFEVNSVLKFVTGNMALLSFVCRREEEMELKISKTEVTTELEAGHSDQGSSDQGSVVSRSLFLQNGVCGDN